MTGEPVVILHLGLPKTATSSLQHNVFQRLHEEGKINFLGKCLDHDYLSGHTRVLNYVGKSVRDAAEERVDIEVARTELLRIVKDNCINVLSDEGLMVAYPGRPNLPLSKKFQNLSRILQGYNVEVVVTLRSPVEYLYSLYVQLYPDYCSKIPSLNSVQKYIERLVANPDDVIFESYFHEHWLSHLKSNFSVKVLNYEDLSFNNCSIYESWAELLSISTDEFKGYFDGTKVNVKTKMGKEVSKVRSLSSVESFFRSVLSRSPRLFNASKQIYTGSSIRKLLNYKFQLPVRHKYPTGQQYCRLQKLLDSKYYRL